MKEEICIVKRFLERAEEEKGYDRRAPDQNSPVNSMQKIIESQALEYRDFFVRFALFSTIYSSQIEMNQIDQEVRNLRENSHG